MKQQLLSAAKQLGGFAMARRLTRPSLRILAYHGFWITPGHQYGDRLFMTPEQFQTRMEWLARSNYPVLALDEAVRRLSDGSLPDNAVVITIDDGWRTTYTHALPILERLGLPATVYVTTYYVERRAPVVNVAADYVVQASSLQTIDFPGILDKTDIGSTSARASAGRRAALAIDSLPTIDERVAALRTLADRAGVPVEPWWSNGQFHNMSADEVRDARRRGLDVQLHTHRHRGLGIGTAHFQGELADNRASLKNAVGEPGAVFEHFCYPSGSYDPAGEAILSAAGVRSATLVEQGINPPGTHPYRLRRFLDGRSVTQVEFEAYLSGALEIAEQVRPKPRAGNV